MSPIHFFISSREAAADFRFYGHTFVGKDLVAGDKAALMYTKDVGDIPFGGDGAYCLMRKTAPQTMEVGTDYKGYFHLYAYQNESDWAIGSSFAQIVDYAKSLRLRITPNLGSLYSWKANQNLIRTVMAFNTSVKEITLLPSQCYFRIENNLLSICELTRRPTTNNYRFQLRQAIQLCRDRVATLATAQGIRTVSHLTGGLDSRVVFSMLTADHNKPSGSSSGSISYVSQTNRQLDLEIAQNVAQARGVRLNPQIDPKNETVRTALSSEDAFLYWRDAHLGSYAHVLFPHVRRQNAKVVVPGLAGETLRHVYDPKTYRASIEQIVGFQAKNFEDPNLFEQWSQDLVKADQSLKTRSDAHLSAMVRNHREFRDRFHTGHNMFWEITMPPLASRGLMSASNALPPQLFRRGKILYDILNTFGPDLLEMPFDLQEKSPSEVIKDNLISIKKLRPGIPGRVYISSPEEDHSTAETDNRKPVEYLADAVSDAANSAEVVEFFGADYVSKAQTNVQTALDAGVRNLHGEGREAHAVCLAKLIL